MTLIIYLLAAALGYSGTGIVARNITPSGEFQIMKRGKRQNVIIVIAQIENFKEILFVLKTEVTTFVNQIADIIHNQTNKYSGFLGSQQQTDTYQLMWKLNDGKPNPNSAFKFTDYTN